MFLKPCCSIGLLFVTAQTSVNAHNSKKTYTVRAVSVTIAKCLLLLNRFLLLVRLLDRIAIGLDPKIKTTTKRKKNTTLKSAPHEKAINVPKKKKKETRNYLHGLSFGTSLAQNGTLKGSKCPK